MTTPDMTAVSRILDTLFTPSQQKIVLAELEQLYSRCERQGVPRADAMLLLHNKFSLEGLARWCATDDPEPQR